MLKAFKYRLYPTKEQAVKITAQFGCCRYIYNWGLQRKIDSYTVKGENLSCFDLINELTALKNEFPWLKDVYSQSLQMSLRHLDNSYTRFFREKKGFPKFKSRKNPVQSCSYPQGVKFRGSKVFLPKIGPVDIIMHRPFTGITKTVTLSRSASNKYYVSVLVETGDALPEQQSFSAETTVGIDVGLRHFAVFSTGEKVEHPKHLLKAEKKLIRSQKSISRCCKGSNNKGKRRIKLAIQHEKVAAKRRDFLHKLSKRLISDNQAVAIEKLDVAGMLKNRRLAKQISASGWAEFFTFLDYKASWYGKSVIEIGRFDPSSKTCHSCGFVNKDLKLKDRIWTCPRCGDQLDRDINAALNIKAFALLHKNLIVPRDTRELTPEEIAGYGGR